MIDKIIAQYDAEQVCLKLAPYLTEQRKQRIEQLLPNRICSVHLAIESPSDPHNAAAIVRTCEALGAMSIHVIAAEDKTLHAKGATQGAFHWVNTHHHQTLNDFAVSMAQQQSPQIIGASMDGKRTLHDIAIDQPLCLLFGNEKRGLSAAARELCANTYRIPMFGISESLNLSVSAAISLYDILSRKRALLGKNGDCDNEQMMHIRLQYYLHSLEERLVKGVLKL